jgi:hypothetical protein
MKVSSMGVQRDLNSLPECHLVCNLMVMEKTAAITGEVILGFFAEEKNFGEPFLTNLNRKLNGGCSQKLLKIEAWVERPIGLIKEGGGAQVLKVICAGLPKGRRECFNRINICNRSESLQDKIIPSSS